MLWYGNFLLQEAALNLGVLTSEEFDELVVPEKMIGPSDWPTWINLKVLRNCLSQVSIEIKIQSWFSFHGKKKMFLGLSQVLDIFSIFFLGIPWTVDLGKN